MPNLQLNADDIAARLKASLRVDDSSARPFSESEDEDDSLLKCAAVLIPLLWMDDEWHVLFTRRTRRVESHKGQVSFPGGACDEGETSAEETALREVQEEIGIPRSRIRILGRSASMITISHFHVMPVVGVLEWPSVFRLNTEEVDRVFTVPLPWLAEPANHWEFILPGRKSGVIVFHPFDGELVWGATARMTMDLLRLLTP